MGGGSGVVGSVRGGGSASCRGMALVLLALLLVLLPCHCQHQHHPTRQRTHTIHSQVNGTFSTPNTPASAVLRMRLQVNTPASPPCHTRTALSSSPVPPGYDKFSMPPAPKGVVKVVWGAKVRELQHVDEKDMDITIQWYLRMHWKDPRLIFNNNNNEKNSAYNNINSNNTDSTFEWDNIDPTYASKMWVPAAHIDHAKSIRVPKLLLQPHSLLVRPDGLMRYSMGVITTTACPMDFTAYPFDKQVCLITLESYQYRTFEMEYEWNEVGVESDNIETDHFFASFTAHNYTFDTKNTKNNSYPRVHIALSLRRKVSYHLLNTYLPSSLFVIVSWLTFLVPVVVVPGRMVLTVTTLLTLVSMFNSIRNESPKVSYAKAIDVWLVGCIMLVFAVLLEYTVVVRLHYTNTYTVEKTTVRNNNHTKERRNSLTSTPSEEVKDNKMEWKDRRQGNEAQTEEEHSRKGVNNMPINVVDDNREESNIRMAMKAEEGDREDSETNTTQGNEEGNGEEGESRMTMRLEDDSRKEEANRINIKETNDLGARRKWRRKRWCTRGEEEEEYTERMTITEKQEHEESNPNNEGESARHTVWEVRLEKYTPSLLILAFLIFNLAYWPYWLNRHTHNV